MVQRLQVQRLEFTVSTNTDFEALRRRFTSIPARGKVLASREGGIDISSPGRESFTLLVGEETAGRLYSGDVRLMPGFGAPPHHQPTEDELWYVLEGELDVRVGHRRAHIATGTFAYIPRNTTHAFKNNGTVPARLLTWNTPAGHERAFEEMKSLAGRGITTFPELKGMFLAHEVVMHKDEAEATEQDGLAGPRVVPPGEGEDASTPGARARRLLSPAQSQGDFDVLEVALERGARLPAADERGADRCLYVLAGQAEIAVDGSPGNVGRGAFAYVPRGASLSIAAAGEEPLRFLFWRTPGQP